MKLLGLTDWIANFLFFFLNPRHCLINYIFALFYFHWQSDLILILEIFFFFFFDNDIMSRLYHNLGFMRIKLNYGHLIIC